MKVNPNTHQVPERLLRIGDVTAITGLGKSSLYQLQAEGKFPQSVRLSSRAVAWPASRVAAWIAEKIKNGSAS